MANHALPTLASLYTEFLSNFKDRIDDTCKSFDPAFTSPTNLPTNTIRWNSATNKYEKYTGTSWVDLSTIYEIKVADSNKLNGQLASYYAVANDTTASINTKVNIADIVNTLTSTDTTKPLSAAQGKALKGLIDAINQLLTSNDTSLNELQEIVNYIKQNKTVLDTLAISNIAGLVSALAGKLGVNDTAANANKLNGQTWNWSGQGGQPDWLWGGSDGNNMYVYNPANFNVWRANDLSNHQWDSKSMNGYIRLSTRLILQWGLSSGLGAGTTNTLNFPITFPNAVLNLSCSKNTSNTTTADYSVNIYPINQGQFGLANGATGTFEVFWMALGY